MPEKKEVYVALAYQEVEGSPVSIFEMLIISEDRDKAVAEVMDYFDEAMPQVDTQNPNQINTDVEGSYGMIYGPLPLEERFFPGYVTNDLPF